MTARRILLTGGGGFLGAWIMRRLLQQGCDVRVFDLREDRTVALQIAGPRASEIEWRTGDIADTQQVAQAMQGCDGVLHLAGVLTWACQKDPVRGAMIDVIGTLNVFLAAQQAGIGRVIYASSAGVFGPGDNARPRPITHYGAYKLANEGSARAFWEDAGIASVGFRPYVVYGPGRTDGLTAAPSLACRAAARGQAYTFPYSGGSGLVFVDDVAAAFVAALDKPGLTGAHAFNLPGESITSAQVISELRRHIPDARLDVDGPLLPFPPSIAPDDIAATLPGLPNTSAADGLLATLRWYQSQT